MAWNIGANDVANAMGTSVGSGALTLKKAIIVAAIFEFAGAFLVGSHVTETVRKGIIDLSIFTNMENGANILLYGMLASLLAAGAWLQIATYFGWPVSTTHSIVGAVVGFGLIAGGAAGVNWIKVGTIVMSWVISPLLSGTIAFIVFFIIHRTMINVPNSVQSTKKWSPIYIFLVFAILTLVTLFKGLKNLNLDLSLQGSLIIAIGIGFFASMIGWILINRIVVAETSESSQFVEKVFTYLQIMSACFVAFAHGANDVANAIGPLAAVFALARGGTEALVAKTPVPIWILGLGGAGIVIGLSMWGWRVIETIGKKITELTPTRGFAAEFAAATTIVLASRLSIPISTTHTLVGGVLGVGLARGLDSLNFRAIREIVTSWIVTLPAGAGMSIVFFLIIKAVLGNFVGIG
ncbi:hypothetical protein CMK18_02070 [Candidatus Poribacteria bacterium]|nr:hypothetical protein [Candidatus Poribacteria bacterium]